MKSRIKAPVLAVAAVFTLSGCNLLDVDNPNSLVESSIELPAAANGVVNGSLRLVSTAVADVWEGPSVVADEMYWTGSRDAWGQLDNGYISDPLNEFTDGAFPNLGQAVWMANKAVEVLEGHAADPGGPSFDKDLARAQMFNGLILMVTGESQEDMTFSNKQEDGAPVGPGNMSSVLDDAIANLTSAATGFNTLGETDLETVAIALRARARMSRVIWDQLNPGATVGTALDFGMARTDAETVIGRIADSDWQYTLGYSEASGSCGMCGNVNSRGENQLDDSLVGNTGPGASGRDGSVVLIDPVGGLPDLAVASALAQWGVTQYGDLTITSERLMRLIVAEDALQAGETAEFEAQINAIRGLDAYPTAYTYSAANAVEALTHHRRVNTLWMGLRLQDMYRWGIVEARWQAGSAALDNPGEMLPITIIEIRANCNLNGQGC